MNYLFSASPVLCNVEKLSGLSSMASPTTAALSIVKMFVDFPNDPSACREYDPQKPPA